MKRDSIGRMLLGFGTGFVFGFILHKGRAADYGAIGSQLNFENSSVAKIMGTAAAVGGVGTEILNTLGLAERKIKPLDMGGIVLGGVIFGVGMSILGYCPGTGMAAMGKGNTDALAGVAGMFGGALAFVTFYPRVKPIIEKWSVGEKTLPEITHTSPWLWAAGTSAAVMGAGLLERRASQHAREPAEALHSATA